MNSTGLLIMYRIYSKDGKYMYVNSTKHLKQGKNGMKKFIGMKKIRGIKLYFIEL